MGNKRKAPSIFNLPPGLKGTKREKINVIEEDSDC